MDIRFFIFLGGFIIGTYISINALYVLIKFFNYAIFRYELKKKKEEYSKNKNDFNDEFDIKLDK